jgi:hypothetical protein
MANVNLLLTLFYTFLQKRLQIQHKSKEKDKKVLAFNGNLWYNMVNQFPTTGETTK